MTTFVKLICTCEASWTRSNDSHSFARSHKRWLRNDPSFLEPTIDNGALNTLNRNRIVIDSEHTRSLARRWTHSAGKLRKVIGLVKQFQGTTPVASIDQVIPVRNQVVKRTTGRRTIQKCACVAERYSTIHTSRRLFL